jgi:hypothetical protein
VATYWPIALVALVVIGLLTWSVARHRRRRLALDAMLGQLGFRQCPDRTRWLEETVTAIECNRDYRYEIRDPRRLAEEPHVYYYVKVRHGRRADQDADAEEEILFRLKRPTAGALVLMVKPSSLRSGLATRMLGALAAGPWDAQPDDLTRLELPLDLRDTNLLAALGPPGARLYDLVDSPTIGTLQGIGDAGGMSVRLRDGWCSIASASAEIPFRVNEILARIGPLL